MATVTITLTDNPADHTVAVHSSFTPAVGGRVTPAQAAAMDAIMSITKKWGGSAAPLAKAMQTVAVQIANYGSHLEGVDIDAVHRTRDNVVNPAA